MLEGSFASKIQKDDLLLQTNGQSVLTLAILEDLIDEATGSSITILVRRQRRDHKVMLDVKDLLTLVPYWILEYASCLFQDLGYEVALEHNLSLKGVVLSSAGGCFDFDDANNLMITSLNNRSTPDLDTFIEVAGAIPGEQRIGVYISDRADIVRSSESRNPVSTPL